MDCRIVQQNIDLFVDGMLSENERQQLLDHVASCASCQKALSDALRLKNALSSLGEIEPPEGLAMSAIKKAKKKKPLFAYISVATAAVAAAAALVVVFTSGVNVDHSTRTSGTAEMYSMSAAEEDTVEMAPAASDEEEAGITTDTPEKAAGESLDDATASTASGESTIIMGAVDDPRASSYTSEEDFVAAEGSSYYRPAALPDGAVLESISVDEQSIMFTYRLDSGDAFVFEWLDALDENGLEDWLEQTYGDSSGLDFDGSYYISAGDDKTDVYWEQDGDAFHAAVPASFTREDILADCQAEFVRVENEDTQ